jgi:threonine/homoserine/homoserine lactone efflux protein
MSILTQILFAIGFGLISTLPLGPSGMSIVNSFAKKGTRSGLKLICALGLAEVIYLIVALGLRARGVLELSNSAQIVLTVIFGAFLIGFGFITFKNSKNVEKSFPEGFRKVFYMSMMNPSLIITYLGLVVLLDKSSGGQASGINVLILSSVLLTTVWMTLFFLGKVAQLKRDAFQNNLSLIKSVVGPIFMIVGLSTVLTTF